jgi:hypothetical protein
MATQEINSSLPTYYVSPNHVTLLPNDIKLDILSFLDNKDLTHGINLANKKWCNLTKNNQVWKPRLKKDYPSGYEEYETQSINSSEGKCLALLC